MHQPLNIIREINIMDGQALQPRNPLPVKEKGDIFAAFSSEAPLTAQSCNQLNLISRLNSLIIKK